MKLSAQHHLVTFHSTLPQAERIDDLLATTELQVVSWTKHGGESSRYEIYTDSPEEAEAATSQITDLFANEGITLQSPLETHTLRREDWEHFWKRFFHVDRVSPRIVICPSWEEYTPKQDEWVIDMDPGMSFGTGQHGTTRACIQFLDALAADGHAGSLLDAGCGSGILAIAAAKLGYSPIRAFDYDADAVRIARENCTHNGVSKAFGLDTADVMELAATPTYDVVAANILAPVLIEAAPRLSAALATHAHARLILSGILHEQYPAVRARFESLGLCEVRTIAIDEWSSGFFRWPAEQ